MKAELLRSRASLDVAFTLYGVLCACGCVKKIVSNCTYDCFLVFKSGNLIRQFITVTKGAVLF